MRLAHVSDIHWRGVHRHDEYRRAFSKFFADLRTNVKPDHIVIGGDIVHSKTQGITPELIDNLAWWFRSMAGICPVHVLLGNHDGNLMNLHRQDAISPIVTALNDERIHLYKSSGVYSFAPGFNFCVFSVFDKQGWQKVQPAAGDVNIALFHGTVAGSATDQGWEVESELDVKFFESFDFCLLGDIHKKQNLAYRNVDIRIEPGEAKNFPGATFLNEEGTLIRVQRPWIAYPGSAIMQSYGESPGKGYLVWDIDNRDSFNVEFRTIEHDCEFHTIDWQGSLKTTLETAKKLPRGSRVRVRSTALVPHAEFRQLTTELQAIHGMSEVVFKDEFSVETQPVAAQTTNDVAKHDLRNPEMMFELFREYFPSDSFSNDEWNEVKQLIVSYLQRVAAEEDVVRGRKWSLKDLWFDNTFGYGEGNYINFKKLSGVTGVFGNNRAGKSSIIGAVLYTLFNGSDRGNLKNLHIINTRKERCMGRAVVSIDDVDYVIERKSTKHESKGVLSASTNLTLLERRDGQPDKILTGEQRTDTDKLIRSLLGTVDDCLLTSIAVQGDINRFVDGSSSYRDQMMSRFLDLGVFEKFSQYAKEESTKFRIDSKNAPDRDWDALLVSRADEFQKATSELTRIEHILVEKRAELSKNQVELASVAAGFATQADVDAKRTKIERQLTLIQDADSVLVAIKDRLARLKSQENETSHKLAAIDVDDVKNRLKVSGRLRDLLSELKRQYEKENQIMLSQERSSLRLAEVPCGDQFPGCKFIKDSHADSAKLPQQREVVTNMLSKVKEAELDLKALGLHDLEIELENHATHSKRLSELRLDIARETSKLERQTQIRDELQEKSHALEIELADLVSRAVYDDTTLQLKSRVSELENEIHELDSKRVKVAARRGALSAELLRLRDERDKFREQKRRWRLYELFINASSKKGIPARIVQSKLPMVNAEISKMLQGIVDYTLRLEKDIESNTTEIYIDYGDSTRPIELGSGMEKMLGSLAVRVALQNVSTIPKPDFLVIDEGFGVLDEMTIESCNRFMLQLKRWYKNIIIISHIDAVKDIADNVIEVSRNTETKDTHVHIA